MSEPNHPTVAPTLQLSSRGLTIALLAMGGIIASVAIVLIVVGARGRRSTDEDAGGPKPLTTPLPAPSSDLGVAPDARSSPVG